MPKSPALVTAALSLAIALGSPAAWAAGGTFDFGPYHIEVFADADAVMTTTDYQITVANAELTLTRLTAPFEGTLSKAFVADLDGDGNFEVVVTYADEQGHRTGLDVYRWQEYLLEPVRLAALDADQEAGYQGGDEIAVVDGRLVRIYQVYEQIDGAWQPTAQQRRLRYSFEGSRWVAEP
ncbi:MAG: hypothetical protein H6977_05550 [Gammaproteobacteria bacterium]|nr:hypothetical protein [Gammaproteobacteria bacterium]